MKVAAFLIFGCLPILAFSQDQWKNVYTESAWAERDVWQKAGAIIQQLSVKDGSRVADVGCHEGYMTVKISKEVGQTGRVFSVDVNQAHLDKLQTILESRKIENVAIVKGEYDDPKLPVNELDAVLIMDTYHEMKSHDAILLKIKASLKPTGRLVICEPISEARRKWTREEQEGKHELDISFVVADLRKAGFQILFKQDRFVDREKIKGDKMWIVVARKQ